MAKNVSIQFPDLELGKVDLIFKVKEGGEVFGDLKVSKGGIEWRAKYKKSDGGNTVKKSWVQLAKLLGETK
jgi:hypothetical protein